MAGFSTHCQYCGKTFSAKRSTAKFCSTYCRVSASRSTNNSVRVDYEIEKIMESMQLLLNASDKDLRRNSVYLEKLFDKTQELKKKWDTGV